ncbi:MAG TPA: VWA domain-containing protein [Acidobacteriaceae bacterium]|nr:VWA domain-containing protein [Acidobacteriaceae bacterium]
MATGRVRRVLLLSCWLASAAMVLGQTGGTKTATQPNPPTFHVNARVVLTDVTVTDRNGNPVRGLKEQAFRIYDDGHPEQLKSFEEHEEKSGGVFRAAAEPSGIYTNAAMLHPPAVVNAILLDTTTIDLVDQMYLYEQLTKFVQTLPAGEPVAIFCRAGQMTLELQSFTSDHAQLMKAVRKAIPHFREPDAENATDYDTMQQMAYYLSSVPGKKNLLWFSGGSSIFLQVVPTSMQQLGGTISGPTGTMAMTQPVSTTGEDLANQPDWKQIYDVLEQERITLYPIDARGLVTYTSEQMNNQHLLMEQDAEATGGQARYDTNGLAQAAERIVTTDGDYYTLTYSPDDLHNNGRWHRVSVKLSEAGYRLSYRRGYFDDEKNGVSPTAQAREVLKAKQGKAKEMLNDQGDAIPFTAQVLEISPLAEGAAVRAGEIKAPKDGDVPYAIIYHVPAADVAPQSVGQEHRGTYLIGSGVLVFDHYGTLVEREGQKLTMTVDEREIRARPDGEMKFDEEVDLPRGEDYLDLVVWDTTTGRLGMMNVSLNVKKPPKT